MKHEIESFVAPLEGAPHVLHIITASVPESDWHYVDGDRVVMEQMGWIVEEYDLAGKTQDETVRALERSRIIYVQGGNTYYLMKYIRESGFDVAVKSFLEKGGIYIGVSAGSIVAGKDIGHSGLGVGGDKNIVDLKDMRGMGLVDLTITPHYEPAEEEQIAEYERQHGVMSTRLTDDEAVLVQDGHVEVIKTHNSFLRLST